MITPFGIPHAHPPLTEDLTLIHEFQQDLTEIGFTTTKVAELLGEDAVTALDRDHVVPGQMVVEQALDHDPLAVLTGLWLVSVPVTAAMVDAALPRTGAAGLQRLRLAILTDDNIMVPQVDLRPYAADTQTGPEDLWVASDLSAHQVEGALPAEHVLGVGHASLTLAGITHRRRVETALDVGTGCGIQLLHLLDHASHVVGTDISHRALGFARFNILLNATALHVDPERPEDRVELLHGSLLEPVAGRRFELVVTNPPFVITPRTDDEDIATRYIYRDGGQVGDHLMADLVTGLPAVLSPGGTAQLLGNWEVGADQQWPDRVRAWLSSEVDGRPPVDAWFIQRDWQGPAEYAEMWLRDAAEQRSLTEYRRRYANYLEDFHRRGVVRVGFGMIWLRAREPQDRGTPWHRFEDITSEVEQPLGPVIGDLVERADQVRADPDAVLHRALVVSPAVTQEQHQRFGAPHPEIILARSGAGFRRSSAVSSAATGFLSAADGEYSAAQLITAVCSLTDTEEPVLQAEVLDLYTDGFLDAPAHSADADSAHPGSQL